MVFTNSVQSAAAQNQGTYLYNNSGISAGNIDPLLDPDFISNLVGQPIKDTVELSSKQPKEEKSLWTKFLDMIGWNEPKEVNIAKDADLNQEMTNIMASGDMVSDAQLDQVLNEALSPTSKTSAGEQNGLIPVYKVSFNGTKEQENAFIKSLKS